MLNWDVKIIFIFHSSFKQWNDFVLAVDERENSGEITRDMSLIYSSHSQHLSQLNQREEELHFGYILLQKKNEISHNPMVFEFKTI